MAHARPLPSRLCCRYLAPPVVSTPPEALPRTVLYLTPLFRRVAPCTRDRWKAPPLSTVRSTLLALILVCSAMPVAASQVNAPSGGSFQAPSGECAPLAAEAPGCVAWRWTRGGSGVQADAESIVSDSEGDIVYVGGWEKAATGPSMSIAVALDARTGDEIQGGARPIAPPPMADRWHRDGGIPSRSPATSTTARLDH